MRDILFPSYLSPHNEAAIIRRCVDVKDRDDAYACVSELKEKHENLVRVRNTARQNTNLEIKTFQDIVCGISKSLLEGTRRKTWNLSDILNASCSARDAVNDAWDKVQSNLHELEKCLERALRDMSAIKDSFVEVAKREIECVDCGAESSSKTRSLLLDKVYGKNSDMWSDFFQQELSLVDCDQSESIDNNEFVTSNLESRLKDTMSFISSCEEGKAALPELKAFDRLCCLQGVVLDHTSAATKTVNRMCFISHELEKHSENLLREYARDESLALDQISSSISAAKSFKTLRHDNKLVKRLDSTVLELAEKHSKMVGFSLLVV